MIWKTKPSAPADFLNKFKKRSPLVLQLLYNRGIRTSKEVEEFLETDYKKHIHSPFKLTGMKKAVERILTSIDKNEKVFIYGDYDADGVCSSALLYRTLKNFGLEKVDIYIPDREKEGHGLNDSSVSWLLEQEADLVITVDCGSRDIRQIEELQKKGVDVLVTDHHETGKKLPPAVAIVNPFKEGDKYPFTFLAGVGVAFKLASAIYWVKENDYWDSKKNRIKKTSAFVLPESVKWFLDMVALATVADVMPLVGENRVLVKYGLGVLAQTRWPGVKELMDLAQVKPKVITPSENGEAPITNLDSFTLGFLLGPRLNAPGRMDHANVAFYLLALDDDLEVKKLAQKLSKMNVVRQKKLEVIVQEIKDRLEEKYRKSNIPKIICEGSRDWPVGLLGLVAGKVAKKYNRPALIYQDKEDLICASFRTVPGFNIINLLEKHSGFFDDYGGHKEAAGFRMKRKKFPEFEKSLLNFAEKKFNSKKMESTLELDKELHLEDITWENYDFIQKLAPFGKKNPHPVFLAKDLEIKDWRMVGNGGKHLKLELIMFSNDSDLARTFKAIAFDFDNLFEKEINKGDTVDIAFELVSNEWNGFKDLEFKVLDLKFSGK